MSGEIPDNPCWRFFGRFSMLNQMCPSCCPSEPTGKVVYKRNVFEKAKKFASNSVKAKDNINFVKDLFFFELHD